MFKLFLICATFFIAILTFGQERITPNDFESYSDSELQMSISSYEEDAGGYSLPSIGDLHVLIVFAEFPDDNYDTSNPRWIKGQAPTNMNDWIDQSWSTTPTQGSLTHYFNEMSGNRLHFTGDVQHVVAPHSRSWYNSNSKKDMIFKKRYYKILIQVLIILIMITGLLMGITIISREVMI